MPRHRSGPRIGRKYPRGKLWIERRDAIFKRSKAVCEVSGADLFKLQHSRKCGCQDLIGSAGFVFNMETCKWIWCRACDHIWPERFCRKFATGSDPHVLANLIAITPSLHAKKTKVEWRIFEGDRVGYVQELRALGFDPVIIDNAWKAVCASIKVPF